jgi:DNA-binding beta-propeller fold protein YncE
VGGASNGTVALYDPRTLRPRGVGLPSAFGVPETLRFDNDDRRLLIESGDRTLRLIDVATATQLGDPIPVGEHAPLLGNGGQLLRPDGKEVAATTDAGIAVWDLVPHDWQRAACRVADRNLTRGEWRKYLGALGPYHETCPAGGAA